MSGNRHESVDVVVVGGRVAGAGTARLLALQGLRVLVVERSGYGTDTHSTHALLRTGVLQLSRWGVLDEIRAAGTPRVDQVVYQYEDDEVTLRVPVTGDVDGLYAPRRWLLDRVLQDAAAHAGVDFRHHTALRTMRTDANGRVRGVVIEDASGTTSVDCELVIGADGTRSTVADLVGARTVRNAPGSTAVVYGFVEGLPSNMYRNSYRVAPADADGGLITGLIPTNDGEANVWVATSMSRFQREGRGAVREFFHRVMGEVDEDLAAHVAARAAGIKLRSFPGLRGYVRQAWGPGWALVGDACHFKDPISSHGITDAFVGAELLARSVGAMAAGVAEADALHDYAARRAALTEPMTDPIERIVALDWDVAGVKDAHRALSASMRDEWEAMVALPPVTGDLQGLSTVPTSTPAAVPGS